MLVCFAIVTTLVNILMNHETSPKLKGELQIGVLQDLDAGLGGEGGGVVGVLDGDHVVLAAPHPGHPKS